jgi:hypothetical protein
MQLQTTRRVLCLHAAAKRLGVPERTLRYRASRGRVPGAFKQGKLWKFVAEALQPGCPGANSVSAFVDGSPPLDAVT